MNPASIELRRTWVPQTATFCMKDSRAFTFCAGLYE